MELRETYPSSRPEVTASLAMRDRDGGIVAMEHVRIPRDSVATLDMSSSGSRQLTRANDILVDLLQEYQLQHHCIVAAYVLRNALRKLGYTANVVGVDVTALNSAAFKHLMTGGSAVALPAHGAVFRIRGTDEATEATWDGHAVVLASRRKGRRIERWVLDPTASQFSAPDKGLAVSPFVAPAPPSFHSGRAPLAIATAEDSTVVFARRPDLKGHHQLNAFEREVIPELTRELCGWLSE
ncbi:hypothetical protein [Geodermatophilus sp. URMC 62]|uniref:hypothetical protein n=1 Tax=Geodermatophilus sp. URMC 62 TaxID=3423414 RepID=UPI00406CD9D7